MKGYKHTDIGIIPNEWEVKTLGEISKVITKGTTPKSFVQSGINYIKIERLT
jgi:type I restriction enzyme, S subunit